MENFVPFISVACLVAMAWCVISLIRNDRVHTFRTKVLHESVFDPDKREFYPYAFLPEYKDMVLEWWKPLNKYLEEAQAKMPKQ